MLALGAAEGLVLGLAGGPVLELLGRALLLELLDLLLGLVRLGLGLGAILVAGVALAALGLLIGGRVRAARFLVVPLGLGRALGVLGLVLLLLVACGGALFLGHVALPPLSGCRLPVRTGRYTLERHGEE